MAEVEDDIYEGVERDAMGSCVKKAPTLPIWPASLDQGGEA